MDPSSFRLELELVFDDFASTEKKIDRRREREKARKRERERQRERGDSEKGLKNIWRERGRERERGEKERKA